MGIVVTPNTLELDVSESQIFTVSGHTGEVFVDALVGGGLCTITKLTSTTWQVTRNSLGAIQVRFSESPFGNDFGRLIGNDDGKTELLADGTMKFTNISSASKTYATTAKLHNVGDYVEIKGKVIWNPSTGGNFFMYLASPWGGSGSIEPNDPAKTYRLTKTGYDKAQFYIDGVASGSELTFAGGDCWAMFLVGVGNSGLNSIIPRPEWSGAILNYSQAIATINNPTPDEIKPADVVLTGTSVVSVNQINVAFQTPLADNVAVTKLKVQRATNSVFTTGLVEYETTTLTSPYNNNQDLNPSNTTEYFYRFKAGDAAGNWSLNWSNVVSATITVPVQITTTSPLTPAVVGDAITGSFAASGGSGSGAFSVQSGNYPNGASLAANGARSGSPTTANTFNFTIRFVDAINSANFVDKAFVWVINPEPPPVPVINSISPLPYARIGHSYSVKLQKSGGSGSGSFAAISGNLPNGAMATDGTITIANVGNSTYNFTARFTDTNGQYVDKAFTIPVTEMAFWDACKWNYKRPLKIDYIQQTRVFEPIQGTDEVIEDKPEKREFTLQMQWHGMTVYDEFNAFLYEHRLRKPFLFQTENSAEYIVCKLVKSPNEAQMLNYGGFEIVFREV